MNLLNSNRKFVEKSWGHEDWIDNNPLYCGKNLFIKEGKRLSLHYHNLKTETFYVQSGLIELAVYDNVEFDKYFANWDELKSNLDKLEIHILVPRNSFKIPVGMRHTLFGIKDSNVIEFSTQHFDEDSIRILHGDLANC